MDFTILDIWKLYGDTLLRTSEDIPDDLVVHDPNAITWRTKQNAKITFIIKNHEISDKILIEFLKKIVSGIGIPFDTVGFGEIRGIYNQQNLSATPTTYSLIFDKPLTEENPILLDGKEYYFAPSLTELIDNREKKLLAWQTMKLFKDKII